jgi:pilus assembly protein CpaE
MGSKGAQITALLVSPDRQMAEQLVIETERTRTFAILGDLTSYPSPQTLDSKIRQLRPDVVLLDVKTNLDSAGELIRYATALKPPIHMIALHMQNDPEAILRSLRFGATEFLYAPFDISIQEAAVSRIQKLLHSTGHTERTKGKVVAFSSAKPGSGASTLAIQTAHALRRATGKRVLAADFDLLGGSIAFLSDVQSEYSVVDLLQHSGRLTHDLWSTVTVDVNGIDVLLAPEMPHIENIDQRKMNEILEYAQSHYDWTVLDLPCIFHRLSLLTATECDRAFLVSTSELASLHLARRAAKLLGQIGVDSQKVQVVINRMDSREKLSQGDLNKLFDCRVDTRLPDDELGIQRVVALGKPVEVDSDLGRAIDSLATKLMGALPETKLLNAQFAVHPAFSQG